ncbi:redoxin domain-containing protein [Piscinibacter sp. XHJ-5]|uniref:redoxin domain-containing protein n=1 Tax=Piscinibacter sp. XHJ-5 TaxID=3037797 RepID=UPI002452FDEE|nr:redoxin domain-containing protein [Piscinibacter sp. XHJ-5]
MRTRILLHIALLAAAVALAVAAQYSIAYPRRGGDLPSRQPAPEFHRIGAWFNSSPLTMDELRGKVVLVDFWTFDCVNCLRHLPHVTQWQEKYGAQGLVVVGVHTPEFAHERSTAKLQEAIRRLRITHAVAQDNDYGTWDAFGNHFWPADYLIDRNGRLVYMHHGEGDYGEVAKRIEALLAEPASMEP